MRNQNIIGKAISPVKFSFFPLTAAYSVLAKVGASVFNMHFNSRRN